MHSDSVQAPAPPPAPRPSERRQRDDDPVRRSEDSRRFRKTLKEGRNKGATEKGKGKGKAGPQQAREAQGLRVGAVQERGQQHKHGGGLGHDRQDGSLTAGMFAMQQAQVAMHQAAAQPTAPATASMAPALADLIAKHVKQLLVPVKGASGAESREVMLTLSNDILPATDLWLSRTEQGWKLRAGTRSPEAYRFLVEQTPNLVKRFADSQLGELEIDPTLEA